MAISCATVQTPKEEVKKREKISYDSIPKEFLDYKNKPIVEKWGSINSYGEKELCTSYDINGDGIEDVVEVKSNSSHSVVYGFDINQDGKIDCSEMLYDVKDDGLNGNERVLDVECD